MSLKRYSAVVSPSCFWLTACSAQIKEIEGEHGLVYYFLQLVDAPIEEMARSMSDDSFWWP